MKIVVWTLASLVVTFIASSDGGRSVVLPESSAAEHFPSVKASNLEKRDFNLPADLKGDRNLLLVAFEREQQKDVDTWLREMKRFEELDPGFHYYELPTIQRPAGSLILVCATAFPIAMLVSVRSPCISIRHPFATRCTSPTKPRSMLSWWIPRAKSCGGRRAYSMKPRDQACAALSETVVNEPLPTNLFWRDTLDRDVEPQLVTLCS